ncbi:hypothetical protein FGF1_35110 [Flavobacteriaceae bacterium GF1]
MGKFKKSNLPMGTKTTVFRTMVIRVLAISFCVLSYAQGIQDQNIKWASQYPGTSANEKIDNAIKSAVETQGNNVIGIGPNGPDENGIWLLDESIKLPSNTTLILAGAHLKMATGVKALLLENEDTANGNTDIHIVGWGQAILDGNASREPERTGGAVHFYNVKNLTIKGLQIGATAGWAFTLEKVSNVHVNNLNFFQGNEHPWQDGIHIVGPANSVVIDNITGTFGDDVVVVDSAMGRIGQGGAVQGVTISNVVATNIWGAAILRTIAAKGKPVEGVYCTNMTFLTKEGGTDAAIKIGWDGRLKEIDPWEHPLPEEHKNIVIENLYIPHWEGPIVTVQNPVKNLTLKNISARHKGPFFYNLEHTVDGLTIDNCHSTLIGNPPKTMVSNFYRALTANKVYPLITPYKGDFINDPPGTIAFDHALVNDLTITNTTFDFKGVTSSEMYPIAVRIYKTAIVDGLYLNNVRIKNYSTGIQIDKGTSIKNFEYSNIRFSEVAHQIKK